MTDQVIYQTIEQMRRHVSDTLSDLDAKHVVDCDYLASGFKALRARLAQGDFAVPQTEPAKKAKTMEDVDLQDAELRRLLVAGAGGWRADVARGRTCWCTRRPPRPTPGSRGARRTTG
jgi:hypothetical protein